MKREIKFRGYNLKNKAWIYGFFLINRGECFISPLGIQNPLKTAEDFMVDPDSVGEWTGTIDSKGVEIYEGDILESFSAGATNMDVRFLKGRFFAENDTEFFYIDEIIHDFGDVVVTGNVYTKTAQYKGISRS